MATFDFRGCTLLGRDDLLRALGLAGNQEVGFMSRGKGLPEGVVVGYSGKDRYTMEEDESVWRFSGTPKTATGWIKIYP